jgi:hypothetical protein
VPMFNEKIIKIVNKHKVITNDKRLPYHVSYMQYFCIAALFVAIEPPKLQHFTSLIKNKFSYGDLLDALRLALKGYQIE